MKNLLCKIGIHTYTYIGYAKGSNIVQFIAGGSVYKCTKCNKVKMTVN